MTCLPPHELRPATTDDRSYIIETWLQSYKSSPFARQLPPWAYWSKYGHSGLVEDLVDAYFDHARVNPGGPPLWVACLPSDPLFIYGWSASFGGTLDYVFVRPEFRRLGFGRAMLAGWAPEKVTHLTPEFSMWMRKDGRTVEFVNPYRWRR